MVSVERRIKMYGRLLPVKKYIVALWQQVSTNKNAGGIVYAV
jgi:hypothetical protein